MPSQDNTSLVRKLFECYNKNNPNQLNCFEEVLTSDVKLHDPAVSNLKPGIQGIKQAENSYITAFPNRSATIDAILTSGDQVIVRWTATGTHKGKFHGMNPTNKDFKISGISIYRISRDKISEIWQVWDHFGLLSQLGELHYAQAAR